MVLLSHFFVAVMWEEIERLYQFFSGYDKYLVYSIIANSAAIEGSTLSNEESRRLFDEGVTAGGKPLLYHLMNADLKEAYDFARGAEEDVTPHFLRKINGMLMRRMGSVYNVAAGSFDSSRGEFRLCGVMAGVGGRSYMNYQKVEGKVKELCEYLRGAEALTMREKYELSFEAHLRLATIHPWVDGNGRTARLLMNYIQFRYGLFPTKVFVEDRAEYISSLQECQEEDTSGPFVDFMAWQLKKSLAQELRINDG